MTELDPDVIEFIKEAGGYFRASEEGDYWGDLEVGDIITEEAGLYGVATWSRGRLEGQRLAGAPLAVVNVYMVLSFGNSWRAQRGLDRLRLAIADEPLPPGFEVSEGPNCSGRLMIHNDPPIYVEKLISVQKAREMAHALSVPLGMLIESYRDPNGIPAFPQGRLRDA